MASEATFETRGGAEPSRAVLAYEADLVRRAKERSSAAWAEIYDLNYGKLFRYVRARVGDRDSAEDLTATVFLEALKSIGSYKSRGRPLLAWLYRIARNVVNHHHRSVYRRRAREEGGATPSWNLLRVWRGSGQEEAAAREGEQRDDPASLVEGWDLREAVGRLSEQQREVIILRYYVGLSTPEVAVVVGKRERAVYSLQGRAIKALRRHLR